MRRDATGVIKRLNKPAQYAAVYSKGSSWACNLLVLRALPNGLPVSRCGFSVSKKIGNAVVRNRVKRQLRELARLIPFNTGWDIVFIVRPASAKANFGDLRKAIINLLSRAKILGINPTISEWI